MSTVFFKKGLILCFIMTQPSLAQKLGVGKSTLANFESGQINTSLEVLDKLHDIFNVSLDDLVYKDLSSSEE